MEAQRSWGRRTQGRGSGTYLYVPSRTHTHRHTQTCLSRAYIKTGGRRRSTMSAKETEELSGREAVEQVFGSRPPPCTNSPARCRCRRLPGARGMVNAKSPAGGDVSAIRQARAAGSRSKYAPGLYEHPCYERLCVGAKRPAPARTFALSCARKLPPDRDGCNRTSSAGPARTSHCQGSQSLPT